MSRPPRRLPRGSKITGTLDYGERLPDLSYPPPPENAPPAPEGWTIVPHATLGVTAYETTVAIDPAAMLGMGGPGRNDFCGLNAAEFHGFPPETLDLGGFVTRIAFGLGGRELHLTYRFLYRPDGWQPRPPAIPRVLIDYRLLPGLT